MKKIQHASSSPETAASFGPEAGRMICTGGWAGPRHTSVDLGPSGTALDGHGVCPECKAKFDAAKAERNR